MLQRRDQPHSEDPQAKPDPRIRWFADATEAQKRGAVHALLAVATGDGSLVASEKTAIADACGRLGVTPMDVASALAKGIPENVTPPHDPRARAALMLDCAAVMVADQRIDDRELAVLLMVGKSLGYSANQVADFAAEVTSAMATSQRRAALLERILDQMT